MNEQFPTHNYSDEGCYNFDTDKCDYRKLKIKCPKCERRFAALCSKKTSHVKNGSSWVGCDYKEYYSELKTVCKCGAEFNFRVYGE